MNIGVLRSSDIFGGLLLIEVTQLGTLHGSIIYLLECRRIVGADFIHCCSVVACMQDDVNLVQ